MGMIRKDWSVKVTMLESVHKRQSKESVHQRRGAAM
jgi:hypothetical protein